jgi:hypothetical protein
MQPDTEQATCPECGHPVYRPLVVPVRHQQLSCRAVTSRSGKDADRCGCSHAVHRTPTMRPRHRSETFEAEDEAEGPSLTQSRAAG